MWLTRMGQSRKLSKRKAFGVILAMALVAVSLANWAERGSFGVPEDGVMWADTEAGVSAVRVGTESPAARVGVRPGDKLLSIAGVPVSEALDVAQILADVGPWQRAEYRVEREGQAEALRLPLVVGEADDRGAVGHFLLALGWVYAAIGLGVWLRREPDGLVVRFFAFCLASLALYSLSSSGRLEGFDRLVYWLDVWAHLLVPALFLDFCVRLARGPALLVRASYAIAVAVGAAHHSAAGGWVGGGIDEQRLSAFFDAAPLPLLIANMIAAAAVTWRAARGSADPVFRLQVSWLSFGALASALPFGALYTLPFVAGMAPGPNQAFSVFSLAFLPASMFVVVLRYRLLDFEPVRRRAIASALTAGLLLAAAYGALFQSGDSATRLDRYAPVIWLCSLAVAAGLFFPIRNWILDALERRAYRGRYEARRALATFATELATETDRRRMLSALVSRLASTLAVRRVAVLAPADDTGSDGGRFQVVHATGPGQGLPDGPVALGPVVGHAAGAEQERGLDRFGFPHLVPCQLRGRTLAWIALGKTRRGTFLASDDLALVKAVAAPFAIALENARLYASLEARAEQYQSLKEFNENIVESLSVGILALDLEGRVQSWNTHLELAFHISRVEAIGRRLAELLPRSLAREVDRCQDSAGTGQVYKYRLRAEEMPCEFRPQGAAGVPPRTFNIAVAALIAKDLSSVGRIVILDDVTERVNLEERLVHADKLGATGLLAAGVAHEVNTPLAVISSYSQLLAEKFAEGTEEAALLGRVEEQTFRATEIVNSLLDFSRTSGSEMAPCDLARAIDDTLSLIAPQLQAARIHAVKDLQACAPVMANKGKLQQVFLNLFLNARDAMPGGGRLRISLRAARGDGDVPYAEVQVADTGTGLSEDSRKRLFDPFYTTKEPGRGSGLGLAVSHGIVSEHSGTIAVRSALGEGTTFTLTFPLANQPAHA